MDVLVNNAGIGPLAPAVTPSLKPGVHYENDEWFAICRNLTPRGGSASLKKSPQLRYSCARQPPVMTGEVLIVDGRYTTR